MVHGSEDEGDKVRKDVDYNILELERLISSAFHGIQEVVSVDLGSIKYNVRLFDLNCVDYLLHIRLSRQTIFLSIGHLAGIL